MNVLVRPIIVCFLLSSIYEVHSLLGFRTATFSRLAYNPQMVATMVPPSSILHPTQNSVPIAVEDINAARELLPWSKSINPDRDLSYMPMFQTQLDLMKSMGMEQVSLSESLVCRHSSVKPARIGNACFKNDKFRKVRLTYFDAGDNVQVRKSEDFDEIVLLLDVTPLVKSLSLILDHIRIGLKSTCCPPSGVQFTLVSQLRVRYSSSRC